jgi:hypothetical protein
VKGLETLDAPAPAISAIGLARPTKRVSSEGNPKMLEPTMALTTSAVSVQRPIDRIKGMHTPPRKSGIEFTAIAGTP